MRKVNQATRRLGGRDSWPILKCVAAANTASAGSGGRCRHDWGLLPRWGDLQLLHFLPVPERAGESNPQERRSAVSSLWMGGV